MRSKAIVNYLKRERLKQKRTLSEVALRAGVSKSSLSDWENYKKDPTLSSAMKWAVALNCDLIVSNRNYR